MNELVVPHKRSLSLQPGVTGSAIFSPCGKYRYRLERRWGPGAPLCFVMLNPSKAGADVDDPTIRKCIGYARRLLYGGIVVVNLFAYISTDPNGMILEAGIKGGDILGQDNDIHIVESARDCGRAVVLGWGKIDRWWVKERIVDVLWLLHKIVGCETLCCLKTNKDGSPTHPLYLPGDLTPKEWRS